MVAETPIWRDRLTADERAQLGRGAGVISDPRPDVLVVGGGIAGVATAAACHAAGLGSVLLIEAGRLGSGATGGAAGLLVPESHQGSDPPALVELGRAGLARWRDLDAAVAGGVGFRDLDWLGLAPHPGGFVADPPPSAEWLDAGQVGQLLPGLRPAVPAARIRHQGRVNPLRALSRLSGLIPQVATGCTAAAIATRAGRVRTVSTSAGTITPGAVVFATGGPPKLDGLDLRLPAGLVKGHLVVTEPVSVTLPGMVAPLATQIEDHRLLAGGTLDTDDATPGVRADITARIQSELAAALAPLGRVRLAHRWCCWRPRHPDGLAVIDRVPGLSNAWVTSGHYRTGILLAPAAGAALASWITNQRRPRYLQPWGAARSSMTMVRPGGAASEGRV
jgi:glycine oxidase